MYFFLNVNNILIFFLFESKFRRCVSERYDFRLELGCQVVFYEGF